MIHALMTRAFIVVTSENIMFHVKHYVFFFMLMEETYSKKKKSVMLYNRITAEKKSAKAF